MKVPSQVLTSPIVCTANTEYDLTGTTLERKSAGYCMMIPPGVNGVTIYGNGTLIGGGVKAEQTDNTTIDGPTVRNTFAGTDGGNNSAFNLGTFTNSKLLNTRSYNVGGFTTSSSGNMGGTAIWMWKSMHRSIFRGNLVEGALEAMHSFHRGGVTSEDVTIEYNEARKCTRHAFEFQNYGICRRWTFRGNLAHDWLTKSDWNGHMAFSLAMGGSESGIEPDKGPAPYINELMLVEGNVALTTGDLLARFKSGQTPWFNSCAFELMGDVTFRNNHVDGWPHPLLVEFVRAGKWTCEGNNLLSWAGGPAINPGKHPGGNAPRNYEIVPYVGYNGEPIKLSNYLGVIGDKTPPPAGIGEPTDPTPPTGSTMNVTAKAYKTYVDLTLDFTGSVGTTALERRAGDGVWSQLATWQAGQTGTKPFKDSQFSADQIANTWKFWYRLRDKNGSTPEVEVQIGLGADPVPPPTNKGFILTQTTETTIDAAGAVTASKVTSSTTKAVQ